MNPSRVERSPPPIVAAESLMVNFEYGPRYFGYAAVIMSRVFRYRKHIAVATAGE